MDKESKLLQEQQRQLLAALLALARKQRDAISANMAEEQLAALLADRGRLLQQLAEVDGCLRALPGGADPDGGPHVADLQKMLREILELDAESGNLLQGRKGIIVDQLKAMNNSVAAFKGYGDKKGGGQGRFVSKKG